MDLYKGFVVWVLEKFNFFPISTIFWVNMQSSADLLETLFLVKLSYHVMHLL